MSPQLEQLQIVHLKLWTYYSETSVTGFSLLARLCNIARKVRCLSMVDQTEAITIERAITTCIVVSQKYGKPSAGKMAIIRASIKMVLLFGIGNIISECAH